MALPAGRLDSGDAGRDGGLRSLEPVWPETAPRGAQQPAGAWISGRRASGGGPAFRTVPGAPLRRGRSRARDRTRHLRGGTRTRVGEGAAGWPGGGVCDRARWQTGMAAGDGLARDPSGADWCDRVEHWDQRPAGLLRKPPGLSRRRGGPGAPAIHVALRPRPASRAGGERRRASRRLGKRAVRHPRVQAGGLAAQDPLAVEREAWRARGARVRTAGSADAAHPRRPCAA